jgi:virulence factor
MKVGVIGTGKMGENHVRTYLSLQNHCELAGIFDTNQDRGMQIAEKYNIKLFSSLDELLQTVDAVSIAVPTEFHYQIGLACIRHKTHMLMEKPISATVEEADDLIKQADAAGITLQVGHIELFNPLIHLLKRELNKENIIGISFQRLNPYDERVQNTDVVKDLMIHDLYLLADLLQDKFTGFYALGNKIENTTKHVAVLVESSLGVTVELTASFKSKKRIRTIQILTEEAFIEANLLNQTIEVSRAEKLDKNREAIPLIKTIQIDKNIQPLQIQLADFLHGIKHQKEPSVSGEQGKQILELTNRISESIHNREK